MRLTKNEHELLYMLSRLDKVFDVVPVKTTHKNYIILIITNGDYWKLPWRSNREVLHDAIQILRNYAETQDGEVYLLPFQFH